MLVPLTDASNAQVDVSWGGRSSKIGSCVSSLYVVQCCCIALRSQRPREKVNMEASGNKLVNVFSTGRFRMENFQNIVHCLILMMSNCLVSIYHFILTSILHSTLTHHIFTYNTVTVMKQSEISQLKYLGVSNPSFHFNFLQCPFWDISYFILLFQKKAHFKTLGFSAQWKFGFPSSLSGEKERPVGLFSRLNYFISDGYKMLRLRYESCNARRGTCRT